MPPPRVDLSTFFSFLLWWGGDTPPFFPKKLFLLSYMACLTWPPPHGCLFFLWKMIAMHFPSFFFLVTLSSSSFLELTIMKHKLLFIRWYPLFFFPKTDCDPSFFFFQLRGGGDACCLVDGYVSSLWLRNRLGIPLLMQDIPFSISFSIPNSRRMIRGLPPLYFSSFLSCDY